MRARGPRSHRPRHGGPIVSTEAPLLPPLPLNGDKNLGLVQFCGAEMQAYATEAIRPYVEALRDLLPYAEACIGPTWRANPPSDSVIVAAKALISSARQAEGRSIERAIQWILNNYQDHNVASLCDGVRAAFQSEQP